MKAEQDWQPTKYIRKGGRLRASRDRQELSVGSRMIGDLVARFYDETVPRLARGRLADLGCGKVPLYFAYRDHVDAVTCVDWSAPATGTDHLDVECDLSQPLPFADESFDTIILSDVMEHIPDTSSLWAELSRLLSTDGVLIMNTPFMHCLHEQPHDYYRFSNHALRYHAEKHGFEVLEIPALGGTPAVLTDITAKHLQFIPLIGRPLASAVQAVTWWFINTGWGKRVCQRTAEAFPLSYGMVACKR